MFKLISLQTGLDADGALMFKGLCEKVATQTNKWKEIALQLDITHNDIERIEMESRVYVQGFIEECFRKVFDKWRRAACPPFTWDTIIAVLEVIGEKHLAQQLQDTPPRN